METNYSTEPEKRGPTNPQRNKRVGASNHLTYESASEEKARLVASGEYSKVKVVARPKGNFEVLCFVPLKKDPAGG